MIGGNLSLQDFRLKRDDFVLDVCPAQPSPDTRHVRYTLKLHKHYWNSDKSRPLPEMLHRLVERHDAENHVGSAVSVDAVHGSHGGAQSLLGGRDHHRDLLPHPHLMLRKESTFKGQDRTRGRI